MNIVAAESTNINVDWAFVVNELEKETRTFHDHNNTHTLRTSVCSYNSV